MDLKTYIRDIPDFPKKGIIFKDVSTLFKDGKAFKYAMEKMAEPFKNQKIDQIVGVEARGFAVAAPIACLLDAGLTLVRKPGKLPWKTFSQTYELEYGTDTLEIHQDAVKKGDRVVIADDLLATGGTVKAVADMLEKMEVEIAGITFLIELEFLQGMEKIKKYPCYALIKD